MARANLRSKDKVQMVNPWSGALPTDRCWGWGKVVAWAHENVHLRDRAEWIKDAREAFADEDGVALGKMIIGS